MSTEVTPITLDEFCFILRSGTYEQGQQVLHGIKKTYDENGRVVTATSTEWCCIGVWADQVYGNEQWGMSAEGNYYYSSAVQSSTGIEKSDAEGSAHWQFATMFGIDTTRENWEFVAECLLERLMAMNDGNYVKGIKPHSFKQIANWCQKSAPKFIREVWAKAPAYA